MNSNIEMILINLLPNKWNYHVILQNKLHSKRDLKIEERMLIVMDKSANEEQFSQPLQTKKNSLK